MATHKLINSFIIGSSSSICRELGGSLSRVNLTISPLSSYKFNNLKICNKGTLPVKKCDEPSR